MTNAVATAPRAGYRADIDGLRGLAIALVVAFHGFPAAIPGGYVGVDIFFVISGYLITSLIQAQIAGGRFSVARFFGRRVLRLFPVLIVVLLAALAGGAVLLTPRELEQLARHAMAGAGFVANFVLQSEIGYFDNAADTKPLLHLWSLGIEEQFYLVWPFVLMHGPRLGIAVPRLLVLLIATSFGLSLFVGHLDPAAAFYLPHTRIWELAVGAWLASVDPCAAPARPGNHAGPPRPRATWLRLAGLLAIGIGAAAPAIGSGLSPHLTVPLAVAGAAMAIGSGPAAPLGAALLSRGPLLKLGLVSYSLYLWHWPLLAFARIVYGSTPPLEMRAAAVSASVGLAALTYVAVEKPLRRSRRAARTAIALAACMGFTGLVWLSMYRHSSLPSQIFGLSKSRIEGDIGWDAFQEMIDDRFYPCTRDDHFEGSSSWGGQTRCRKSKTDRRSRVALVGDSHAEHLFIGIAEALPRDGVIYYAAGGAPYSDKKEFAHFLGPVESDAGIEAVVLAARWNASVDAARLRQTVRRLTASGKRVLVVDSVPDFPFDASACKIARWPGNVPRCSEGRSRFDRDHDTFRGALLAAVADEPNAAFVDTGHLFCDAQLCSMVSGDSILYRDADHLNIVGSRHVGAWIVGHDPALGARGGVEQASPRNPGN